MKSVNTILIKSVLVYLIPLLFTIHGIVYNFFNVSSSFIIYTIKISTFFSIVPIVLFYEFKVFKDRMIKRIFYVFLIILFFNIVSSFINFKNISFFYFFADLIGLSVTFIYLIYLIYIFKYDENLYFKIIDYSFKSGVFICLGIILNYILSQGNKVSIPPELQYIISISFISFFVSFKPKIFKNYVFIFFLIIGIVTSQLRINFLLMFLSSLFGLIWILRYNEIKNILINILSIFLVLLFIYFGFEDILISRFESLQFTDGSINNLFLDNSANQRILEIFAILDTIKYSNNFLIFFGHGFGSTYYDMMNLIPHYPLSMHNSHVSYFSVFFRNGFLGLFFFLIPLFYSLKLFLFKSKRHYVFCVVLFLTYLALIFDQYVYWGFYYALATSSVIALSSNSN